METEPSLLAVSDPVGLNFLVKGTACAGVILAPISSSLSEPLRQPGIYLPKV